MYQNKISLDIAAEDLQLIREALQVLQEKLIPHLVELNEGEIKELPKMGDKSYAFVVKAEEFADQYPEFAAFVDRDEFSTDVKGMQTLRELAIPFDQINKKLQDSLTLSGCEAYTAALTYYGTAKEGLKRGIPNAQVICTELGNRFPGRSRKQVPVQEN